MPNPFQGLKVVPDPAPTIKRRYSVTQDIVGFRRCARQYGAFHVHKYAPAHQTQLYFGTILHQVLDRCHGHYHGVLDPSTKGTLPDNGAIISNEDVEKYFTDVRAAVATKVPPPPAPTELIRYFIEVEDGLKSQGIRAITTDLRHKALRILQYFNALEGPTLYPRVRDTELRLQADQTSHILHGVVDLLVESLDQENPEDCEIWDYKGMSRVSLIKADLDTYLFQMRVYANLYRIKFGVLPKRVVLYFLGELVGDTCPQKRPINATLDLNESTGMSDAEVQAAMQVFGQSVQGIEQGRATDTWPAAPAGNISDQDCAICDLRWDCPTPQAGRGVKLRHP